MYFRAQNYESLPSEKPSQEDVMNKYDDNLTKRSVPNKFAFKLFNLYNPSENGKYHIKDDKTDEEEIKSFSEVIKK